MSLTGPVFLDGLIALTVAAFVALVVLWPRLTARTPWHIAGRAGALAVVNLLVLLTAASQLNATYLFFSGWADLRGAFTGHLDQSSLNRGGSARQAPDISLAGAAPVLAHVPPLTQPVSSTGLLTFKVPGPFSGLTGEVLVQLPPGYTSAPPNQRYPVLEAFHGYPSDPVAWLSVYHLQQYVDQLASANQLRAPIIVMPQVEFPRGVDTEGVNGPVGNPQVETWLTRDIPLWLGRHFRVVANRNAWATIGYSAGGYDSAMAPILHPAQYGAGIVLGGYFRPSFDSFYTPFSPRSALGRRYDLIRQVARRPPPVSMWVETSRADPVSYPSSARFLAETRRPMAVHAVVLKNAGHRSSVWTGLMPQALAWLGRNVAGFTPQTHTVAARAAALDLHCVPVSRPTTKVNSCPAARRPAVPRR